MISIWLEAGESDRDLLIAELWEAGSVGITEASGSLRAFFADETNLDELESRFADYQPVISREEDRDWVEESREHWKPIAVGERFYLVPEWRDDPAPCGRIRLRTYPGMACGTGAHPCTQLCLQALERHLDGEGRVLDIGTGSGILAQAAHLLGAEQVFACDIDHQASLIARENFRKSPYRVPVFTGSLRSVRSSSVQTAVANLNAETLRQMPGDLQRIAAPQALLILSGFREDEATSVVPPNFRAIEILEQDGWSCQVARRTN